MSEFMNMLNYINNPLLVFIFTNVGRASNSSLKTSRFMNLKKKKIVTNRKNLLNGYVILIV